MVTQKQMIIGTTVLVTLIIAVVLYNRTEHFAEIRECAILYRPQVMDMLNNSGFQGGVNATMSVYDLIHKNYRGPIHFNGFYSIEQGQDWMRELPVSDEFNCIFTTLYNGKRQSIGFADEFYSRNYELFIQALMENPRLDRFIKSLP